MGYTVVALKEKIMDMYPEIEKNGILVGLVFNDEKNAYELRFRRGGQQLSTHLEKRDADQCIDRGNCVDLSGHIDQLISNFVGEPAKVPEMRIIECCGVSACIDNDGYLLNFHDWDEKIANALAGQEGMEKLSAEQLDILRFVRNYYEQYNYFPVINAVCKNLHQERHCISEKFINPAVVWKLAGLPKPDAVLQNLLEHNEPPT